MSTASLVFLLGFAYLLIVALGGMAIYLLIEVKAMQKSTHQIMQVPVGIDDLRDEILTDKQKKHIVDTQDHTELYENIL